MRFQADAYHTSDDEFKWIVNTINTDIIFHVHTENRVWFKERYGDYTKLLEEGGKL